jgi:L-fuculose-phosphate aldolase
VCHLHPLYATGFAVAGIPLDQDVLSEAVIVLGKIPLVEYGTPGSEELSSKLLLHLRDSDAFLLANHGALTVGANVFDAYNKMETLEHVAQIVFIAKQLGNLNILSAEQIQKLTALREKFGIKTNVRMHSGKIDSAE